VLPTSPRLQSSTTRQETAWQASMTRLSAAQPSAPSASKNAALGLKQQAWAAVASMSFLHVASASAALPARGSSPTQRKLCLAAHDALSRSKKPRPTMLVLSL